MPRLVIALLGMLLASASWSEDWLYTVRPGDELWTLASKYCGSPQYTDRLAAHNQLGEGRLIRPGNRIRIPIAWLVRQPADAEVISVSGTAYLHTAARPRTAARQTVLPGARIAMGHSVETAADGSVAVQFADESVLMIAPDSLVLFNVLTAYGDTGMVDTNLRFYKGRGTSRIIRRQGGSRFRISTPSGTAAVRGTEFRVGVEPAVSFTETLDGDVAFIAERETQVPAGFGVAASPRGVTKEALLPAPQWISQPGLVPLGTTVEWQPLAQAARYRIGIYRATDQRTTVASSVTAESRFTLADLAPGDYLIAVRGASAAGIEGYEGRLALSVKTAAPAPRSGSDFRAGEVRLTWQPTDTGPPYLLQLDRSERFDSAAEYSSTEPALTMSDLAAGRYVWRVKDSQSTFSEPAHLTVRPAAVDELRVHREALKVSMTWSPVSAAERYRIQISRRADFSATDHDEEVTQTHAEINLNEYGTHYVRVIAMGGGLSGDALQRKLVVQPRPWWLLSLLILPVLAL